jgi:hypothetical protein
MAQNGTPTDPWLVARGRYVEDLDEEEKKLFVTASLDNLFHSANAAQKDHEEKSRSRAISKKLEPFVASIDQFGVALDVYSNTYSLAMSPLWGSIRVLLHVESNPPSPLNKGVYIYTYTFRYTRSPRPSKNTSRSSSTCSCGSVIFFRDVESTGLYSLAMNSFYKQYRWRTWTSYISVWMPRQSFGN